jgi:hypothetical protein
VAADTGTAVHEVIEKNWDDDVKGNRRLGRLSKGNIDHAKAAKDLRTFYKFFAPRLSKDDLIEKKFTIPYTNGVKIRGMFDRVTSNGVIYDWKTNKRLPVDLSTDPQFILYHYAYSVLNRRPPASVFFASLPYGKLVKFRHNKAKEDILLNEIIPDMLEHIYEDKFNPTGIYRFTTCRNCFFKKHCHRTLGLEEKNELDSTKFDFR